MSEEWVAKHRALERCRELEKERDDALTRLRIEKELRVRVQEERDMALARIEDLGDEIKALYWNQYRYETKQSTSRLRSIPPA